MQKNLKRYGIIFTGPTVVAFLLAFAIPFVMGVYLSFCSFTTIDNATFVGTDNFGQVFAKNERFLSAFGFTLTYAVVAVVTINIFAFLLALLLTKKIFGTNAFRTVFFMPNLIGGIVLGYTWQTMLNAVLLRYETTLVTDAKYGYVGLLLLMNWQMVGYMMVIYIAGIQNVPADLIEAARIDGASRLQTLKTVILPMMMPSITICTFLSLANSFKLFDQNLALTGGAPMNQTEMLALNIFQTFYGRTGAEGVGQAKAVVFFLIVASVALLQLCLMRKKEVEN